MGEMRKMVQLPSNFSSKRDKAMTEEQFEQIVDAILNGKYSWACLLILRFAGYNPLHYIPYRTYNRLIKDNNRKEPLKPEEGKSLAIRDLNHLKVIESEMANLKGGFRDVRWF
jgi:hypothetical protein